MRLEALHKKNLVKAKKIMVDSVTDQIVPQVSSLNTPKMFDSLTMERSQLDMGWPPYHPPVYA